MQNRRLTTAVLIIIALVAAAWAKRYFSPEQVVRRQLLAAVEAFESEQLLGVISVVSRSYTDLWGQSYESIAGNIGEVMATYADLHVDLDIKEIDRVGEAVRIRLEFVVSGNEGDASGYVVGSLTDPCDATILWREEPQGWRLFTTEQLDIPELRDELARMESANS